MKRRVAIALATTLLVTLQLAAQRGGFGRDVVPEGSRVEYKTFQSKLLNREIRYGLYLPVSYANSTKSIRCLLPARSERKRNALEHAWIVRREARQDGGGRQDRRIHRRRPVRSHQLLHERAQR